MLDWVSFRLYFKQVRAQGTLPLIYFFFGVVEVGRGFLVEGRQCSWGVSLMVKSIPFSPSSVVTARLRGCTDRNREKREG
eukprot:1687600-Ditylum_brightwellii.AAC.1